MLNRLRSIRFFHSCPDSELALLEAALHTRKLAAQETLYEQGEAPDAFYLLLSGRLRILSVCDDRRPEGPGDQVIEPEHLIGASAVLGIARRSTVIGLTPAELLVFPSSTVSELAARSPWLRRLLDEIQFKAKFQDQILGWLRHTGVFRGLPPRELERVLAHMRLRTWPAGATVIRQGERGASMGLIVRGEARMVLDLGPGKRVEIATLTEGDLYGETGLLADAIRETTVQAVTPMTVLVLHRQSLLAVAGEAPYLMQAVSRVATDRFEDALEARVAGSARGIAVTALGQAVGLGRTTLLIQLAASLEKQGLSVGLVDACTTSTVARMLRVPVAQPVRPLAGETWTGREVGRWRKVTLYHLERSPGGDVPAVEAWISRLKERHDVVLIDTPAVEEAGPGVVDGLLETSEWVLHFTRRPDQEMLPFELHRRDVLRVVPDGGGQVELPYIGRDIQRLPWDYELSRSFTDSGIPWVLSHPSARASAIVRRLKRAILRRQVGIALAGGGNWGFSHIGVLQVLEENRVAIDMVAGTSAGALIGGLFSAGLSAVEIERLVRRLVRSSFLRYLRPSFFVMGSGILSSMGFEHMVQEIFQGRQLTGLEYPFWPNAMDATTGEEIVFRHGPMYHGVAAAAALPGLFAPYAHHGRVLIDGGFVNNLPLGILYEMGCNLSIGVNCIPHLTPAAARDRSAGGGRPIPRLDALQVNLAGCGEARGRMRMRRLIAPLMTPFTAVSTLNMVMRGVQMLCHRIGEETGRLADVYIAPDVGEARWFEFHKVSNMVEAGRRGALEALDRIVEVCPRDE